MLAMSLIPACTEPAPSPEPVSNNGTAPSNQPFPTPPSASELIKQGDAYRNQGQWDNAVGAYSQALELENTQAEAYYGRGIAYNANGQYDLAIADFTEAMKLQPKEAVLYYNRGITYDVKGQYDLAIADFTQAIELNPSMAEAYDGRGKAYAKSGDLKAAMFDLDTAITIDPKLYAARLDRGTINANIGQYDQAISDLTSAILLMDQYDVAIVGREQAIAYMNRGWAYFKTEYLESALNDFNAAIKLDPNLAQAYCNRALVNNTKGKYDLAISDFQKTLELTQDPVLRQVAESGIEASKQGVKVIEGK